MLTKNTEIEKINSKLESADPSSLSSLGSTNQASLDVLSSRINGVMSSSGADRWDCNIRTQIQTHLDGTFRNSITKAKASSQLVADGSGPVTNLKTISKEYCDEFDKYAKEYKRTDIKQYNEKENDDGTITKTLTSEYLEWRKLIVAYETALPQLEDEALRVKGAVASYFSAVNFSNNTVDSKIFTAGSADIRIQFGDLLLDIARIPDEEYVRKYEPEWKADPENPGKFSCKEEFTVNTDTPDGGHYEGDKTVDTVAQDINGDGAIDETDEMISQKVHEEGIYTAPDGKQYGYVGNSESDEIGIVHQDKELTDKETGDSVYKYEEDREAAYQDQVGIDTTETTTVETTKEEKVEKRTIKKGSGDKDYQETVTITQSTADEQCGSVKTEDGHTKTVYRDDSGKLREKEVYTDKDGKEQLYCDREIEESKKTFTITYPDGKTESMEVNPNNPIDQQRIRNKLEDARSQYYTDSIDTGGQFIDLFDTGSTSISDAWGSDAGYQFTLE